MSKRSLLLAVAVGLLTCSLGTKAATAGTVMVYSDVGTFNFVLTANGAGNIMIAYSNINLTTINGVAIPGGDIPSLLHAPSGSESINVTSTVSNPPLTTYTFNDLVPGIKAFGVGPTAIDTAKLQYSVTSGYALPGFLNLNAHIFSVISPLMETTTTAPTIYDFSPFANGGTMSLTYTENGANFAQVIANGGTITGGGAFGESVPEPASLALLGIGMTGFFAFRRFFKRTNVS